MDTDAPRPVPDYPRDKIHKAWFYCLHCKRAEATDYAQRSHTRTHLTVGDADPVYGEDYTNGEHLFIMLDRWQAWSLAVADKFALALASLRGADDFELEVGEGLPE